MKHKDFKKCICCNKGMMHNRMYIQFYRLKIDFMLIDVGAVQRANGLEQMMGNAMIANVMGPDEDLAQATSSHEVLVCMECATDKFCIPAMVEKAAELEEDDER